MKILISVLNIALLLNVGESFSKYGRTCKDIGCGSNEICVMAEDPCSWNSGDQCGTYPTCRKTSNEGPSCTRYVCPPTKICKVDGDTPKCVDDTNAHTPDNPKAHNNFATYNENTLGSDADQPVYPVLPGQTTPRPAIRRRPGSNSGGGGYDGGSRGSGYPGQPQGSGYPSGYPRQGSYPANPSQGYGGGHYNQGGYGGGGYQGGYGRPGYNNQGGYSQPGYNQGGGGYYSQNNNRYGQKASGSDSNPLLDSITGSLKTWGTNIFKNALGNIKL